MSLARSAGNINFPSEDAGFRIIMQNFFKALLRKVASFDNVFIVIHAGTPNACVRSGDLESSSPFEAGCG